MTLLPSDFSIPFQLLRLDASIFGEQGISYQLSNRFLELLQEKNSQITLKQRTLGADLPHFSADILQALSTPAAERNAAQACVVDLADTLIAELQAADMLLIGAPMYNFGIPTPLKAWMDLVGRAGATFRYTSQGPEGLVKPKPVYIMSSRGGVHLGQLSDTITPQLTAFLGLLGLNEVHFVYAEGLNTAQREQGIASGMAQVEGLFQSV